MTRFIERRVAAVPSWQGWAAGLEHFRMNGQCRVGSVAGTGATGLFFKYILLNVYTENGIYTRCPKYKKRKKIVKVKQN